MENIDRKIELLAPAGNMSCLRAAVINGADAVYLGASSFSARAKAGNFTDDELIEAVEYCHLFSVKAYLAINTILKPSEYQKALSTVIKAKNAGIDAIIVQDLGFLDILRSTMPDIIVHLSTQAGVHNLEGALVAEKLGVKRIVLSRETTLNDIKDIKNNTNLEIESFIHGALCIAFSGNCYLSSLATGNSGNRGRCLQFCRKKFSYQNTTGYLLSPKDFNLTNEINELIDAGVTSLKIEGRMRRPEYVAAAVRHYRAVLSSKSGFVDDLKRTYNRGEYCSGYVKNPTANLVYTKAQGHLGVKIGTVERIVKNTAIIKTNYRFSAGDGLKFLRNGIEIGSALVSKNTDKITFVGKVSCGDEVRLTTDSKLNDYFNSLDRKLMIDVNLTLTNETILCKVTAENGISVTKTANFLQPSINNALSFDSLRDCFNKTGDTCFCLKEFTADFSSNLFATKAMLNSFRREVYETLKREILVAYTKNHDALLQKNSLSALSGRSVYENDIVEEKIIIQTHNPNLIETLLLRCDAVAFFPKDYNDENVIEVFRKYQDKVYLVLPVIARNADVKIIKSILSHSFVKKVIVNNIYGVELAKNKQILYGIGMNIINPTLLKNCVMSIEYDGEDANDNFIYSFGRPPVMTFAHCPKKTIYGKCISCNNDNDLHYTDENKNIFPIHFYKMNYCYAQMLNCVPIYLLDKKINKNFIDLTGLSDEEITDFLDIFDKKFQFSRPYTRGYYNKKLI